MLNPYAMYDAKHRKIRSAIFITFTGNCRKALTYYQSCFGGSLQFDTFDQALAGYAELPIVMGSLIADDVVLYGTDLLHDEGRLLGNYLSIFLQCNSDSERQFLIKKLCADTQHMLSNNEDNQRLIEFIDVFNVRWVLAM